MRFAVLPLTLAGLALSACYDREASKPVPAPANEQAAELGGVDLGRPVRVLGTEPFWSLDITRDSLVFDRLDHAVRRAPNHGVTVRGTTATYSTSTSYQEALNVMLVATECSDGMSDRTYPLTARVEFGDQVLTGCAASLSAINTAGESGLVVDKPAAPAQ